MMPVEPTPMKYFVISRILRWLLFAGCIGGLAYLIWERDRVWGVALLAVLALFWAIDIRRGDQTEDYIFENYEDPRI